MNEINEIKKHDFRHNIMYPKNKKTSHEWYTHDFGCDIVHPTGWIDAHEWFEIKITVDEYLYKQVISIVKKYSLKHTVPFKSSKKYEIIDVNQDRTSHEWYELDFSCDIIAPDGWNNLEKNNNIWFNWFSVKISKDDYIFRKNSSSISGYMSETSNHCCPFEKSK